MAAEIVSMELIKPSEQAPLHNKHLKPSFLDQFAPPCYTPLVFFYQKPPHSAPFDPSERTSYLKQALSMALAKFYPLAGRLNSDDLSIDCDDSGALFVEAKFPASFPQALQNATLPEVNQFLPFHPLEMDTEKLIGNYLRNEILFAAKVSWFDCGSYAIGACLWHVVCDVMCMVSFMKSWASASRSGAVSVEMEPDFESGALLFPAIDLGLFPGSGSAEAPSVTVKNVTLRLLFDKEKIAELKGTSGSKDPTRVSRVEVVTAFLWKHLIKLERSRNEDTEAMFIARQPVNVRSRISSLVSSGELAFGNLIVLTSASFMLSGKDDDKPYHDLVQMISAGLRKVDEDFVIKNVQSDPVAYLKSINSTGVLEGVMVHDCYFTSWNRFQMYEVNFGWGIPDLVTPVGTPAADSGVAILMGTPSGDGIEAWISLREDDIPLLPDEFSSLATTRIFPEN